MKKLTKDQRYNRKRRKDGKRDFSSVQREDGSRGVRVTRRALSIRVSAKAYERLCEMSAAAGVARWEMLTRILIKSLPSYASHDTSQSITARYSWPTLTDDDDNRKVKYKGVTGDKQITYDITSTAWKKLDYHKVYTGLSKARIVQSLILNYKPLTEEQKEKQKQYREEYLRSIEEWKRGMRDEPYKNSKFINRGNGDIVHKKGIAMEYWDEAEVEEYFKLCEESMEKRKHREGEREEWLSRLSDND
tara:strand:+ start:455 stop:1195 length:741 start_codon:yes stop_codon:yes gene_type:complete